MRAYFLLLRPKQWTKNFIIFAALIFSAKFSDAGAVGLALVAFAAMCLVSSATYIVNDALDAEKDRLHPKKKFRPIASGEVSVPAALLLALVFALVGLILGFVLARRAGFLILAYLVIQVLYNVALKKMSVADVYAIASGFILRAVLGAAAINVKISAWLLFCTAALALMLGFSKRRNEFIQQGEGKAQTRESLAGYSRGALDALVIVFATCAALCYGVYSIESKTASLHPGIFLTTGFVWYGISRYVLLVFNMNEGSEPADILLKDKHMIFSVVGFIIASMVAISLTRIPLIER